MTACYIVIAADHRYPSFVSSRYATVEYVSRTFARRGNAERHARELAELFATVTVVAAA